MNANEIPKRCSTCSYDAERRCRRGVWVAGENVSDEALKQLRTTAADKCFYYISTKELPLHRDCVGCRALIPAMWVCELGYPIRPLRRLTPGTPCPKPMDDEELERWS